MSGGSGVSTDLQILHLSLFFLTDLTKKITDLRNTERKKRRGIRKEEKKRNK